MSALSQYFQTIEGMTDEPLQASNESTPTLARPGILVMDVDSTVGDYAVRQTGDKLETIGGMHGVAPQGIVVAKDDTATAEALRQARQQLIDDGTYMRILEAWGVESGAIETSEINPEVE